MVFIEYSLDHSSGGGQNSFVTLNSFDAHAIVVRRLGFQIDGDESLERSRGGFRGMRFVASSLYEVSNAVTFQLNP